MAGHYLPKSPIGHCEIWTHQDWLCFSSIWNEGFTVLTLNLYQSFSLALLYQGLEIKPTDSSKTINSSRLRDFDSRSSNIVKTWQNGQNHIVWILTFWNLYITQRSRHFKEWELYFRIQDQKLEKKMFQ